MKAPESMSDHSFETEKGQLQTAEKELFDAFDRFGQEEGANGGSIGQRYVRGKYLVLKRYLQNLSEKMVKLSFSEIQQLLGKNDHPSEQNLPKTAMQRPYWWFNTVRHHTLAWREAGYEVKECELGEWVLFKKHSE